MPWHGMPCRSNTPGMLYLLARGSRAQGTSVGGGVRASHALPMYACAVVERLGEARGQGKDRWWSRASMCTMACAVRCSRGKPSAVLACVCSVCVPSCRASAATLPLAYLAIFALIGALFESPHGSANEPQCPTHHQCLSELVCSPAGPLLYMLVVVLSP